MDFFCKSYIIKSIEKINTTSGLGYELVNNGGSLQNRIYFFMNSENIVIGIRKNDYIVYTGRNGLEKYLNYKK